MTVKMPDQPTIELLHEAVRLMPEVGRELRRVGSQPDLDRVIEHAREVVEEAADQGWI